MNSALKIIHGSIDAAKMKKWEKKFLHHSGAEVKRNEGRKENLLNGNGGKKTLPLLNDEVSDGERM